MNFGQRSRDLLLDLKKSDWLPPYDDENVRGVLSEIQWHFDELSDQVQVVSEQEKPPIEARPSLLLHDAAIRRNKRCLLAYQNFRLKRVKALQHEQSTVPPQVKAMLSEAEVDFLTEYDKIRANYGNATSLNLMSFMMPPEHDLVQVRILTSLGTVVTESGATVNLEKGTLHYLPRADVEPWIRQGAVAQVNGEENY